MQHTRTRRLVLLALVAFVIGCAGAPTASARDSEAPPGASDRWLPCEDWVMLHWLPYEEQRLYERLGLTRSDVRAWLRQDRYHTLAQLAIGRGLDVNLLVDQLVEPWGATASPAQVAVLRSRAERTLTQGHLAQHVLLHSFHQPAIALRARELFGVSPMAFRDLRLQGISPAAIGRANGRPPHVVARRTAAVLRRTAADGVRAQAMPPGQASRQLDRQLDGLDHWVRSRIAKPGHSAHGQQRKGLSREALTCRLFSGRYVATRHPPARSIGPQPAFALQVAAPWPGPYAASRMAPLGY